MRVFINRTPEREGKIYSVFSENNAYALDVEFERTAALFSFWRLIFKAPSGTTTAEMRANSLNFNFFSPEGAPKGCVREAPFSIAGKSIVEDETGAVIGFVRTSGLSKMTLLSPDNQKIAEVTKNRDQKSPLFIPPSKIHLLYRYVLKTISEQPLDDRIVFCVICDLVVREQQSLSGGS